MGLITKPRMIDVNSMTNYRALFMLLAFTIILPISLVLSSINHPILKIILFVSCLFLVAGIVFGQEFFKSQPNYQTHLELHFPIDGKTHSPGIHITKKLYDKGLLKPDQYLFVTEVDVFDMWSVILGQFKDLGIKCKKVFLVGRYRVIVLTNKNDVRLALLNLPQYTREKNCYDKVSEYVETNKFFELFKKENAET